MITPENILNASYVFEKGERVYYVVTLPEYVVTRQLLIQVYKRDNKEMRYGYKLVYGKNIKLSDEQQNYYTDYFVFNGNRVCRHHHIDCATIINKTSKVITIKWDAWGEETFEKKEGAWFFKQ